MDKKIINSFIKSKYFSNKHMNYFDVYDFLIFIRNYLTP